MKLPETVFRECLWAIVCLAEYILKAGHHRWERWQPQTVKGFLHLSILFCHYNTFLPTLQSKIICNLLLEKAGRECFMVFLFKPPCPWNGINKMWIIARVCVMHIEAIERSITVSLMGEYNKKQSRMKESTVVNTYRWKPEWKVKRWDLNGHCPIIF